MSDLPDYQKAIADAEAAASRGEMTVTAEALQRAAVLQTAALGPAHPDIANTLNNLGVVAERLGWFEEAEAAYRRANTIAEASLPPDHPFVGTSQRNLRDFCIARGLPIEVLGTRAFEPETAPASLDHAPAPVTVVPDVITPEVVALTRVETTMPAVREAHSARRLAAIVAAVLVLAVMAIVLYRTTLRRDSAGTTSGQRADATPVPGPAVPLPTHRGHCADDRTRCAGLFNRACDGRAGTNQRTARRRARIKRTPVTRRHRAPAGAERFRDDDRSSAAGADTCARSCRIGATTGAVSASGDAGHTISRTRT